MTAEAGVWNLPFGERAELEFNANTGSVMVLPVAPGETPRLELRGSNLSDAQVLVRREGRVVRATVEQQGGLFRWLTPRDYQITLYVPETISARISSDAGAIDARDLGPCDVSITTTAGRIGMRRLRGRIHAQTTVGQIVGDAIAGSVSVISNVGEVKLGIVGLDHGRHEARTNTGAVSIELAPGIDVRVETATSIGAVKNYYPSRPDASAVLRVQSDVGAITIRETGQAESHAPVGTPMSGTLHATEDGQGTAFVSSSRVSATTATHVEQTVAAASPLAPTPTTAEPHGSPKSSSTDTPSGMTDADLESLLQMVQDGTVTVAEAMRLIRAARSRGADRSSQR